MTNSLRFVCFVTALVCSAFLSSAAYANNLSITNVSLGSRNPTANTVILQFDLSLENSWRTKINHDAIWITVRLYNPATSPANKKLCQISASGLNPSGTSVGNSSDLEISVPNDKLGAFLRPLNYGMGKNISASDVELTIDYGSCGFEDNDTVNASVLGIEMVYIPEGSFYAGDYDASIAALDQGSADSAPWYISSNVPINVDNPSSGGYRYVSNNNAGEDSTGTSFTIPASFSKGYGAFYAMKYEITEGQWVEFLNSLPSAEARANRDLTDGNHKNTDSVKYRNTINCSGTPLSCSTSRPSRPVSYLTWMDLSAFLDWVALRPMTELEFEKVARGPILPIAEEFAWGSNNIVPAATISSGAETGTEIILDSGANANYNNMIFSDGDAPSGVEHQEGPLRGGIFATTSSTRETAGAGYYGVMDLSGNLRERVVTIGNVTGRNFIGSHGDGLLATVSGFEGNATQADWPGIDPISAKGITGADGSGFKGGGWDDQSDGDRLRISDRQDAANASTAAYNNAGGRGVRTYDGN